MANSKTHIITVRRVLISILFGLLGFWANFHSINFMEFTEFEVTLLWGLIFPLVITMFWGWRYGLISALAGGCQSLWFLWLDDGYGILYSVPVFTLWIIWHGIFANIRQKSERHWYFSMYIVELPFRLVIELGFFTVFRYLVSLNPPFWDNSVTNNFVSWHWLSFVARKHLISSYVLLLCIDALYHLQPVRKIFGLKNKETYLHTSNIVSYALLMGCILWVIHSIMDYLVFYPGYDSLLNITFTNIPAQSLFSRNLLLVSCLISGLLLSRYYRQIRKNELKYLATQMKFKSFIETSPDIIFILNNNAEINYVNPQATKYFNSIEKLIGKSIFNLLATGFQDITRKNFIAGIKGNDTPPYEIAVETDKAGKKYFEVHATSLKDKNGEITGRVSILRDITKRLEAEKVINEKNQFLNLILETNPNGITIVNTEGMLTYANKEAEEILELEPELTDKVTYNSPMWHITDCEGKTFSEDMLPFNIVKKTKKPVRNIQHCIERHPGKRKTLLINAAPVLDKENNLICAVMSIEDITKRKKNELELNNYRTKLEQLVVERTAELEEKNDNLQDYLKIFQEREFRIKTLKKEKEELEKKLYEKNL